MASNNHKMTSSKDVSHSIRLSCTHSRLTLRLVAILSMLLWAALPAASQTTTGEGWVYGDRQCRREITLAADPDNDRSDTPLFVHLDKFEETPDLNSICVIEVTGGAATPMDIAAYAEPTGQKPTAFWIVPGATARGGQRYFHLYYNKTAVTSSYDFNWRDGASFGGSYQIEQLNSKYFYYLRSNTLELKRGARNKLTDGDGDPHQGAFYENNPDGEDFSHLRVNSTGFSPMNGIRLTYSLNGSQFTDQYAFNVSGSERSFNDIRFDRNGPSAAMGVDYTIPETLPHHAWVTHRLFKDAKLMELSLTVQADDGSPLSFARDIFHSRKYYWPDNFNPTRLVTDTKGDEAIHGDSDVKTWHALYDSSSRAIGLFTDVPSLKQHWASSQAVMDYYQLAAEGTNTLRVYYALGTKDEVLGLFRSMKLGCRIGAEQVQAFDILSPVPGARLTEGESLSVTIDGPLLGADLALRVLYPDGIDKAVTTYQAASSLNPNARIYDLSTTIQKTAMEGDWNLSAISGGFERTLTVHVQRPDHPRCIFTSDEMDRIRARWTTDSRYTDYLGRKIRERAETYYAQGPIPDDDGHSSVYLRSQSSKILTYASLLMMEPDHDNYRQRMWEDFDTVIRWPRWDPTLNGGDPFRTDDVTRSELLLKLTLAFDWHNSDLTPQQRREYAEMLARYAETIFELDLARPYAVRWDNNNWIDNNRSVTQNTAIAMVERAVTPYIPDSRRSLWRARLESNFQSLMETISPDGSDNESYSYNKKTIYALELWCETRRLNGQTGVYNFAQWFANASRYELFGMIPGHGINLAGVLPFGNGEEAPFHAHRSLMGLLGMRLGDPLAQWIAENSDYTRVGDLQPFWTDYSQPSIEPQTLPNWNYSPERGLFVFRSSWEDDAMYFTAKCGPLWGGHEHPDVGTFALYRDGYPYVCAAHYLVGAGIEDENIMLINGKAIEGRSPDDAYTKAVPPEKWGRMDHIFGSPQFFNIVANPAAAYEDGSGVTGYTREFVGFGSLIVLRENVQAASKTTFRQLMHGYRTDPLADPDLRYDHYQYPTDAVYSKVSNSVYRMYPNQAGLPGAFMTIADCSRTGWSTQVVPWKVIPEKVPGYLAPGTTRADNSSKSSYQLGQQFERVASNVSSATSVQVLHFDGGALQSSAWDTSVADDGVVVYEGSASTGAVVKVVWPKGGSLDGGTAAQGLNAQGALVMRNYREGIYGGRALTRLRDQSAQGENTDLIVCDQAADVVSNFAAGGADAWLTTQAQTHMTFYHPEPITRAYLNGQPLAFSRNGLYVTFDVPVVNEGHLETASGNAAKAWGNYE